MLSSSLLPHPLPIKPSAPAPTFILNPQAPEFIYTTRPTNKATATRRHQDALRQRTMADKRFNDKLSLGLGRPRKRPYRDRDRPTPTATGFLEVQISPGKGDRSYDAELDGYRTWTRTSSTPSLVSGSRSTSASSFGGHWSSVHDHPDTDTSDSQFLPYTPQKPTSIAATGQDHSYFGGSSGSPLPELEISQTGSNNKVDSTGVLVKPQTPFENNLITAIWARNALQIMIASQSVNFTDPNHARIAVAHLDVIQPYAKALDAQRLICDILFYFSVSIYEHVQSAFRKGWYINEGSVDVLGVLMERMEKATGGVLDFDHATLRDKIESDISRGTFFASG